MRDYDGFYNEAKQFLEGRIFNDYLRCFCYGTDASCYRYVPKIVIKAHNEDEIIKLFELSNKFNTPLCFRAAGSSLSGQSCSDSILVIANFGWQDIYVDEKNGSVHLGCGVIGSNANEALKPINKKIGPDPATITTAMVGGIVSNNSSGMCCGVKQNSYNTIKSIRVILKDGFILDTSDPESIANFRENYKEICKNIKEIRDEISKDDELKALIQKKFKIKNTTGYSINAFVDFEDEIDIIAHLFVGAEGTLGFVSKVEYELIDDAKFKACALLFYDDIFTACKVVEILAGLSDIIDSAELMDYASLRAVAGSKGVPSMVSEVSGDNSCILLQTQNNDEEQLKEQIKIIKSAISHINPAFPALFSTDAKEYDAWWKIRKGILPIAAGKRESGTTVITEDLCFEVADLGSGIARLRELFVKYKFDHNAVIFGHALAGNIHFIITPNLSNKEEFDNFANLVKEMSYEVAKFGGSIKAEHGTGRMIAPFVELEWGKKAYEIKRKIKEIFDPKGLINPDVIICDDPEIFKKNIKEQNAVEDYINGCMECGFCERICPSKNLTLTPRQRITLQREIARLEALDDNESRILLEKLQEGYKYLSDETCAACSMCSTLCPLEIDTAKIALNSRQIKFKEKEKLAQKIINNMDKVTSFARIGLGISHIFGANFVSKTTGFLHKKLKFIPKTSINLPRKNSYKLSSKIMQNITEENTIIYFTTCINRGFAPSNLAHDKRPLQEVVESLCKKANINVIYPKEIDSFCCGKAFVDFADLNEKNIQKNEQILKNYQEKFGKNIRFVVDHGACSGKFIKDFKGKGFEVLDLSQFLHSLLPNLKISKISDSIGLYTMCASKKLGFESIMLEIAKACVSGEVLIHTQTGCCGFAGNKGFFTPELNKAALIDFGKFYQKSGLKVGYSNSSTCEIGLSDSSKFPWQSIAYLLDKCSI